MGWHVRMTKYRFFKVQDGKSHFAAVEVETRLGKRSIEILDTAKLNDRGYRQPQEWVESATRGAYDAICAAEAAGTPAHDAVITALLGTIVDTTQGAVYCAAYMATWQDLGLDVARVVITFRNSAWELSVRAEGA